MGGPVRDGRRDHELPVRPAAHRPAGAQDVAAAVAWTVAHVDGYGGDPDRIVVAGHSAGATHVASFVAGHGGPGADSVAAAMMLSGIYDVTTAARNQLRHLLQAYFGRDESLYPARSALPGLVGSSLPMLFSVAELDLPESHQQAWTIVDQLFRRDGLLPPFVWTPGHTHVSDILSLGLDEDAALGPALRRFIDHVTTPTAS